jgi:UDP:flavonoid glycosyltransferase YjiC (YdhE family)
MQVLFTTLREKSHFSAIVPFIEACQRRGHSVAVAAPPDLADRVVAIGVKFFPFGHPGDEGLRPIWNRFRGASVEELTRISIAELFAGACAEAAIPGLLETIAHWRPSIVLRESHEFAGIVAAEKLGVPSARIAICAPGSEAIIRGYAAPAVDANRRRVGLPPDPSGAQLGNEPALTLFPPSFEPLDATSSRLFRCRAARKQAVALPDWWGAETGPFVYVTLGTVTGKFDMIHAAYRAALDALADLPIRALLTTGADLPAEALGEVPPNVHVERFIPQDDVIPHAAAVLCHGGSGTVLGALAAGVPLVVSPMFADQPYNARCVVAIGAGLDVPVGSVKSEALQNALSRVLGEASFRVEAQRIAQEIAALPPIDDAAIEVERLARR